MGLMIILSPAKTLDFSDKRLDELSQPRLLNATQELVGVLKEKSLGDLMELMNISEKLGNENYERYQNFRTPFTDENAQQALIAFKGDVYLGLDADSFTSEDQDFAQDHLRILSGLYGLLRPYDLMQPYRLEMGTKLKTPKGKNLYEFWGQTITDLLNEDLKATGNEYLVNLASKEYAASLHRRQLKGTWIDIDFKENRNGKYRTIAFNAKKARGAMARQIIQRRIETPDQLKGLVVNDYVFNEEMSETNRLVFTK
jgi:hypothetical protein